MKINSVRALIIAGFSILILSLIGLLLPSILKKNFQTQYSSEAKLGASFELIDSNGNKITEAAFVGSPTVLFFGFTHCPTVCPLALHRLSLLIEKLGKDQNKLKAYFITLDPERDTWKVLNKYLTGFNNRIIGITGESEKIKILAKSWGIYSKKVPLDGDNYSIDHTALIFLLKNNGNFLKTIDFEDDFELSLKEIKKLL
ncbi:MAG: SCO family protein [Pelagibacteraceae bacterium]|jgi:protein SCO1/2|nr:SCO family protein [Pelagibacteraceae bacterium]MDP6710011.1 SCO family protein [Pelagibacteraceae bacterium]